MTRIRKIKRKKIRKPCNGRAPTTGSRSNVRPRSGRRRFFFLFRRTTSFLYGKSQFRDAKHTTTRYPPFDNPRIYRRVGGQPRTTDVSRRFRFTADERVWADRNANRNRQYYRRLFYYYRYY